MLYSYLLLAIAFAVHANPFAMPQAVTEAISPSASPPPGCTPSALGTYGIAVQNVSNTAVQMKRQVAQLSEYVIPPKLIHRGCLLIRTTAANPKSRPWHPLL